MILERPPAEKPPRVAVDPRNMQAHMLLRILFLEPVEQLVRQRPERLLHVALIRFPYDPETTPFSLLNRSSQKKSGIFPLKP